MMVLPRTYLPLVSSLLTLALLSTATARCRRQG